MKKILAIVLVLVGVGGGAGVGMMLKPPPEPKQAPKEKPPAEPLKGAQAIAERSFVKIGRQTIVPVIEGGETTALMMFELAIDVPNEQSEDVHALEPRLRDAFLREMLRMSHTGAFLTNFTDERIIEELRHNLTRAARDYLGNGVAEVLILDVMRQKM